MEQPFYFLSKQKRLSDMEEGPSRPNVQKLSAFLFYNVYLEHF